MNLHQLAHSLVANLLRASPYRPKRKARTWARHQMVAVALPELERHAGRPDKAGRQDRAVERAAEWLNEHGDDIPPEGWVNTGWQF